MSLSVSLFNVNVLQGGTQDNGTWQTPGNPVKWVNTMIGDGGQSGFDAANPRFRFHTFYDASPDVNFSNGDIADWNWMADPIFGTGAPVLRADHLGFGGQQDDVRGDGATCGGPRRGAWAR